MNKTAFLNIVRQVAPIQDQEVEDLEKLVVSFPYCQTAHVLLAKAAYDRGSMLSTQKLRRAAAHVSNRALLKRLVYAPPIETDVALLEEPAPAETFATVFEPVSEKEPQNTTVLFIETEEPRVALLHSASPETEIPVSEELPNEETEEEVTEPLAESTPPISEVPDAIAAPVEPVLAPDQLASSLEEDSLEDLLQVYSVYEPGEQPTEENESEPTSAPVAEALAPETEVAEVISEREVGNSSPAALEPETPAVPQLEEHPASAQEEKQQPDDEFELLNLIQIDSLVTLSAPIPAVDLTHEEIVSEIVSTTEAKQQLETPSVPEENEASSGLETKEQESSIQAETYTASEESNYQFPMMQVPSVTVPDGSIVPDDPYLAIYTQNSLAYWMGSSRLGESIQLKDELTSPTPYYFQPELILEHVKGNGNTAPEPEKPQVAKLDIQLDIINQFLKTTPRRKTLANVQQSHEPQEDLSAKSSKIKKNLASENLAQIFIKQGKTKKAVKIYEQLIVKFPEKKSYFAQQIEKLRNEQ